MDKYAAMATRFLRLARRSVTRAVRWSLATVEDETPHNVIPMPGPAHGPVPAIRLRREEEQRRKAS